MNIKTDDESGLSVVVSRALSRMAATTNKSFTAGRYQMGEIAQERISARVTDQH